MTAKLLEFCELATATEVVIMERRVNTRGFEKVKV